MALRPDWERRGVCNLWVWQVLGKRSADTALFRLRVAAVLEARIILSTRLMLPLWQPNWLPQMLLRCLALRSWRSVGVLTMRSFERASLPHRWRLVLG